MENYRCCSTTPRAAGGGDNHHQHHQHWRRRLDQLHTLLLLLPLFSSVVVKLECRNEMKQRSSQKTKQKTNKQKKRTLKSGDLIKVGKENDFVLVLKRKRSDLASARIITHTYTFTSSPPKKRTTISANDCSEHECVHTHTRVSGSCVYVRKCCACV